MFHVHEHVSDVHACNIRGVRHTVIPLVQASQAFPLHPENTAGQSANVQIKGNLTLTTEMTSHGNRTTHNGYWLVVDSFDVPPLQCA